MRADYRVYAHISCQSRAIVASACTLLAYMGAHQVENIYKDGLLTNKSARNILFLKASTGTNLNFFGETLWGL